ncbi:MAG: phosphoglucomutase/phosphomannomutase family protein [Candidatus Bipolaricaulota bacterium]|nr:phosphoglucomutase/phosphomannomutase family protein [Candidatus Bipolaricaulota bacterium]
MRDDRICFGTDGWRAIIAQGFTFDNVARVAQATAGFLLSSDRRNLGMYRDWGTEYRSAANGLIVGYDTRFLSREFAYHFARVLHDSGIPAVISAAPVPTPALSYAVIDRRAVAGVMITASHNPAIYNGIKFKSEYGGSAPAEVTTAIEERLPAGPSLPRSPQGAIARVGLKRPFLSKVRTLIEPERLTASPVQVVIDSMYGSAQGYVSQLLSESGIPYIQIRGARRPLFGGKQPEPLEKNLIPLRAVIASQRSRRMATIGVATDGDGDRISAMDEGGGFIDAHRTFALILRYLVEERGWRGAVVKSFALTDMAKELCREYGLELIEVPIGFKHICEQIVRKDVLIGAEESGSIAIRGHIPERDGILCSMLLTEIAATARRPISTVVNGLLDAVGPHVYHRRDIEVEGRKEVVDRLTRQPPDQIAGHSVRAVETMDGVKLRFKKGWLLFRASGTEPILRIYCEMPTEKDVYTLLEESEKLARGDLTLW